MLVAGIGLFHRANSAPDSSCDSSINVWRRLYREKFLAEYAKHDKPNADVRKRIDEQVETGGKELAAACRKFGWPATYRRCMATASTPDALERCFPTEYDRGRNRELCEPLLDHYMALADVDFADLYREPDHDAEWVADFRRHHLDSMRPWCIERGLVSDTGGACARAAKTRSEFLACGKAD